MQDLDAIPCNHACFRLLQPGTLATGCHGCLHQRLGPTDDVPPVKPIPARSWKRLRAPAAAVSVLKLERYSRLNTTCHAQVGAVAFQDVSAMAGRNS